MATKHIQSVLSVLGAQTNEEFLPTEELQKPPQNCSAKNTRRGQPRNNACDLLVDYPFPFSAGTFGFELAFFLALALLLVDLSGGERQIGT